MGAVFPTRREHKRQRKCSTGAVEGLYCRQGRGRGVAGSCGLFQPADAGCTSDDGGVRYLRVGHALRMWRAQRRLAC